MFQNPQAQNVLIPQGGKCFNTPVLYTTIVDFEQRNAGSMSFVPDRWIIDSKFFRKIVVLLEWKEVNANFLNKNVFWVTKPLLEQN